jgi:hypothetical protein
MDRPHRALCIAGGLLSALLLYELFAPLPTYAIPAARVERTVRVGMAPVLFIPPPAASFAAIADRPLFDAARKKYVPPPASMPDKAAPPPPPNLFLVGVIIDSERRLALMKPNEAALAASYAVGDQVQGWQVSEIDPDRVVLKAGTVEDDLRMDANKATNQATGAEIRSVPPAMVPRPLDRGPQAPPPQQQPNTP